ncbi:short-chain dehydrogenase/reductase [Actinacidiphila glaucinigra]|nr:short-chain dehydrogenase/reductase [Streptomyces sp. PA03-3a]
MHPSRDGSEVVCAVADRIRAGSRLLPPDALDRLLTAGSSL